MSKKSRTKKKRPHQSISTAMQRLYDFGFCPVNQRTKIITRLENSNDYPVNFRFLESPFEFEPDKGTIPPRSIQYISIFFTPKGATVLISKTVLYADNEEPVIIKLSAIGKYPFISILHNKISFDSLLIGKTVTKDIHIKNMSQVHTRFQIEQIRADSYKDSAFQLNEHVGTIPPKSSYLVKVEYTPTVPDLFSCARYRINCLGGNTAKFSCRGTAKGFDIQLSDTTLNFGEIKVGNSQKRVVHVVNNSRYPTTFQFYSDKKNIFSLSKHIGVVNAKTEFRIVIKFTPKNTMNYYERIYCVGRNHTVMFLDLLGTGYNLLIKPLPLIQRHIKVFRKKVIDGTWDMKKKKPKRQEIFKSQVKKMKEEMLKITRKFEIDNQSQDGD